MVKQTIQIYARVKPLSKKQTPGIYSTDEIETSGFGLEIIVPHDLSDGFVNNKRESYKFKFQKVFDQESKQDDIFETIAKPVAECSSTEHIPEDKKVSVREGGALLIYFQENDKAEMSEVSQ